MAARGRTETPGPVTALLLVALLAASLLLALPVAPARAEVVPLAGATTLTVEGRGYGHGRGMSQNGAQGAALAGLDHLAVLRFYYPGTSVHDAGDPPVRVRVTGSTRQDPIGAHVRTRGALLALDDVAAGTTTALPPGTTACVSRRAGTGSTTTCSGGTRAVTVVTAGPARLRAGVTGVGVETGTATTRYYRGSVVVVPEGTDVVAVVHSSMQEYLRGVVPLEVPASWHTQALRAQSVAARTYALRTVRDRPAGQLWDLCDTTACQVFNGVRTVTAAGTTVHEHPATDAAVQATRGTVLRYAGVPALTEFSAANGGWSVARAGHPYLVAKPDPYDGRTGSVSHRWSTTVPVSRVEASWPAVGDPLSLTVLARDGNGEWGGRALSVRITGTTGSVTVTGEQLRFGLGLRSSWFLMSSDAPTSRPPVGSLDPLVPRPEGVLVRGWAADPDSSAPVLVRVFLDGTQVHVATADRPRPDVAAVFPAFGGNRGYEVELPVATAGVHRVCTAALDPATAAAAPLGCRDISLGADPRGSLDPAEAVVAGIRARGWAWDADSVAPTEVHLWLDGRPVRSLLADVPRPDVARAVPGAGPARGFDVVVPAGSGPHRLCAYGIDTGVGTNRLLGCRETVVSASPGGRLEQATPAQAAVDLVGWAVDPDLAGPVDVHSYVSGRATRATADLTRGDLPAHLAAFGPGHGFRVRAHAMGGPHRVCSYGINVGPGSNALLGCSEVVVGSTAFGRLDGLTRDAGSLHLHGWAIDPDVVTPVTVHVYVDGRYAGATTADASRDDVAAVHPLHGARHGYRLSLPAPPGPAQVCAYAIDVPHPQGTRSSNPLLGCREG